MVEARLGKDTADTVLAVTAATAVYAVTQAPATVAVEFIGSWHK